MARMPHSGGKICAPYSVDTSRNRASTAVTVVTTTVRICAERPRDCTEGLIVADEFDSWSREEVEGILDVNDPVGSLLQVVLNYEAIPERRPWRRVRYFFQEPSVRMAVCAALDRASQRIAPLMMTSGTLTETQARVAANALVFGYFGALEQWYLDGGIHPIAQYVEEGLLPLRSIWSTPNESDSP